MSQPCIGHKHAVLAKGLTAASASRTQAQRGPKPVGTLATSLQPAFCDVVLLHAPRQGSGKTYTMSGREDVLELDEYEGARRPAMTQPSRF